MQMRLYSTSMPASLGMSPGTCSNRVLSWFSFTSECSRQFSSLLFRDHLLSGWQLAVSPLSLPPLTLSLRTDPNLSYFELQKLALHSTEAKLWELCVPFLIHVKFLVSTPACIRASIKAGRQWTEYPPRSCFYKYEFQKLSSGPRVLPSPWRNFRCGAFQPAKVQLGAHTQLGCSFMQTMCSSPLPPHRSARAEESYPAGGVRVLAKCVLAQRILC